MTSAASLPRGLRRAVFAAALPWLAGWLWLGRYAMLDDALIHLRYAHRLLQAGFLTFDGVTRSFGASSPLFVALLASLSTVCRSPLLGKAVSVAAYLALVSTVAWRARGTGASRPGWLVLAVALLSPMALYWLTDGMETGLGSLLAILLATVVQPSIGQGRPSPQASPTSWAGGFLSAFLAGLVAVFARVELSLAIFFAVTACLPLLPLRRLLQRPLGLALGGLSGMALLYKLFGQVIPDTALAKRTVPEPFTSALYQVGRSTASSLSFGLLVAALWLGSLIAAWRRAGRRARISLLLANLLFPTLVALIALHGQILHGVRHVLWVYLFLIAWNLGLLHPGPVKESPPAPARWRAGLAAAAFLAAAAWAWEGSRVARLLDGRSQLFLAMRGQSLERLRSTTGAAFDIGFIAYFSEARMLDFSGLVNGRARAVMPIAERTARVAAEHPDFLFISRRQAGGLRTALDLSAYSVCARFRLPSLSGGEPYVLALRDSARVLWGPGCREPLLREVEP
jgi:hypothetical protein